MNKKLERKFFEQPTLKVAQSLLGKYLVRNYQGKKIIGQIYETEAYVGEDDLASHASRGRTPRTEVMYSEAGHAYIYLVYGMHYMFNIVTEKKNFPAAVLICSIKVNEKLISGPGKISKFMKFDKSLNAHDLIISKKIWVEDSKAKIYKSNIKKSPRVGIPYAKEWQRKLWRFILS